MAIFYIILGFSVFAAALVVLSSMLSSTISQEEEAITREYEEVPTWGPRRKKAEF